MSESIYAKPDMNKKVKIDRGEMEIRVVDIYVSSDTQRDGDTRTTTHETDDTDLHNVPGDQHSESEGSRKRFVVVAVCLGLLCVLLTRIIILSVYFNRTIKEKEELQIGNTNLTKERDQLQEKLSVIDHYVEMGWRYFGSSLYFLSTEKKTWEESRRDCRRRDADLVIINSEGEQKFVFVLQLGAWIGLTDKDEEGTSIWVDGTVLTVGYWYPKQPDNGKLQEDCVEIYSGKDNPVKIWNDLNCDVKRNWICEKMV